jgi:acyl-CoA thioester hydrolase
VDKASEQTDFSHKVRAGWGDMDFNGHMRNTAYLDKAADVRMLFYSACGFAMGEFIRLKLGPIVLKDEIRYFKEIHLLEEFKVSLELTGISEDGSNLTLTNVFIKGDGRISTVVRSTCGWLDLNARKLVKAPPPLLQSLKKIPRSDDFTVLSSSLR